ncbi:MAG: acetylornithine deacetylase [Gammaproteobacteria bacterium]
MAHTLRSEVLRHLEKLVSFDTTNPPRAFDEAGLYSYLQQTLPDFKHTLWNHGEGRLSLLSVRGEPSLLFNFHMDTVPATNDWTRSSFELEVRNERAVGLGACDIKGAAACMLTAALATDGDVALLFTSDEEAGNSHCIKTYLAAHNTFNSIVVAEPTKAEIVRAHRGIVTGTVRFKGAAGHASAQSGIGASAVHQAVDWSHKALSWASSQEAQSYANLEGIRFNVGTLNGGIKPNMIAPSAELKFGLRSLPDTSQRELLQTLNTLTERYEKAEMTPGFIAPALTPTSDDLVKYLQGPVGPAVDFWTEAALFAGAGCDTVVWGPGDIAQAHTADEWVDCNQLDLMTAHYQRILEYGSA